MIMTKAAFDKIAEGLTEALEIARGTAEPRRLYVPPEIDVRGIRAKARMTQDSFASAFGFTVHQIRQWEQGRSRPLGAMRAYLMLIEREPRAVLKVLHAPNARKKGEGRSAA
jgi:putative transcriptional regulator